MDGDDLLGVGHGFRKGLLLLSGSSACALIAIYLLYFSEKDCSRARLTRTIESGLETLLVAQEAPSLLVRLWIAENTVHQESGF